MKGVKGRNKRDVSVEFQVTNYRKKDLFNGGNNRFKTYKGGYLSNGYDLSFGMNMLTIVRRVRVDNHYPVDIVHVGEHRNARLIRDKQSQQKER